MTKSHDTVCSYCGVGCGITISKSSTGTLSLEGNHNYPVNEGLLCSKGKNLLHVVKDTSDRILHPYMRLNKNSSLMQSSWSDALDRTAKTFSSLISKYGPDSVAFYVSGQCLTEEYYIINKLCKGYIGTNNIDTNSRLCMSSAVVGQLKTFGEDIVPISYKDIEIADTFLITGANPAWCHPILFRRIEKQKKYNPAIKIIVIDPRRTDSCNIADLHLQIKPGTDSLLLLAIGKILFQKNAIDKKFIQRHTQKFEAYKTQLKSIRVSGVADHCGISKSEIYKAAEIISKSKRLLSMWAMGLNQSSVGVDKNFALLNLHLLLGQIGKPGCGPFSLTGQPNAMGGREVGGMASLLAVHKDLANPKHRQDVAQFWGVPSINPKPGLTATQIFESINSGKLKALWVICTNPAVSMPHSNFVRRALKDVPFLVVQDISHRSDTSRYADVLLPAAGWMEKSGTMTNSERRVSYLPKIIDPPGEAKSDVEILTLFAARMGYTGFKFESSAEVFDEYKRMTQGTHIDISGLSHRRLEEEGSFQWPVPHRAHPGTPRLFTDHQFYTPTGKAQFNIVERIENNRSDQVTKDYPYILNTGRIRDQWHTMTRTGKVNKLLSHIGRPYVEIHPLDAEDLDITDGATVLIWNERGKIQVRAKLTDAVRQGNAFIPMHYGKILGSDLLVANNLTSNNIDPLSKQPDFKYSAVGLRKFTKPKETICVIGAGAAAYRLVTSHRQQNPDDIIHVFSKEAYAFYNRVMLPEYLSQHKSWDSLVKMTKKESEQLHIHVHYETVISRIDRSNHIIETTDGVEFYYDKLVLATGSRPFVPVDVPMNYDGLFTIRYRKDADRLANYISSLSIPVGDVEILVVGGGLLGLEISSALKSMAYNISLIQRGSRLMERQLDPIGSSLLADDVKNKGIEVYFENEVSSIFKDTDHKLAVSLKSGKRLKCHVVVYAIGTVPNIELAKQAGIACGRGVIVNEYLTTSDPDVFAIGEIAQYKKALYGITAAAEEQADVLAGYLNGDVYSYYRGSTALNILKFADLDLFSIGIIPTGTSKENFEEMVYTDLSNGIYKKCIIKDDRLVGVIMIGDKSQFGHFRNLIENKIELSDIRSKLILGDQKIVAVKGAVVCSCNNIGVGNIQDSINDGNTTLSKVCKATGAGLGCGSCKPEVQNILSQSLEYSE